MYAAIATKQLRELIGMNPTPVVYRHSESSDGPRPTITDTDYPFTGAVNGFGVSAADGVSVQVGDQKVTAVAEDIPVQPVIGGTAIVDGIHWRIVNIVYKRAHGSIIGYALQVRK